MWQTLFPFWCRRWLFRSMNQLLLSHWKISRSISSSFKNVCSAVLKRSSVLPRKVNSWKCVVIEHSQSMYSLCQNFLGHAKSSWAKRIQCESLTFKCDRILLWQLERYFLQLSGKKKFWFDWEVSLYFEFLVACELWAWTRKFWQRLYMYGRAAFVYNWS